MCLFLICSCLSSPQIGQKWPSQGKRCLMGQEEFNEVQDLAEQQCEECKRENVRVRQDGGQAEPSENLCLTTVLSSKVFTWTCQILRQEPCQLPLPIGNWEMCQHPPHNPTREVTVWINTTVYFSLLLLNMSSSRSCSFSHQPGDGRLICAFCPCKLSWVIPSTGVWRGRQSLPLIMTDGRFSVFLWNYITVLHQPCATFQNTKHRYTTKTTGELQKTQVNY